MADFNYKFKETTHYLNVPRFRKLYKEQQEITEGFNVFFNDKTTTHLSIGGDSITILGYIHIAKGNTETYLSEFLETFSDDRISEAKKIFSGQYIAIIHVKGKIYIFSDFLQTRSIYYNIENKSASSSFTAMKPSKNKIDDYKAFEFLAMKHCIYPAWLGNTTIDHNIKRIRAYEYLIIDIQSGNFTVKEIKFTIDNSKIQRLKELKQHTLSLLREGIRHLNYENKRVAATITGGFDSRIVTSLVKEYYKGVNLRISTYEKELSLDYSIASQVADALSSPLTNYVVDLDRQKEDFYFITEGFTPRENSRMIELLKNAGNYELGFGGAYGTELYSSIDQDTIEQQIKEFLNRVINTIEADEEYYRLFEEALSKEFENIREHYIFKVSDVRDIMKVFRLINTGYFSSGITAAYNINGAQYEVFGTFPIIEAGFKIPYKYMGNKFTFGRFYMIPKTIMEKINLKVSRINTTHFCPMRPLSMNSLSSYIIKKIEGKKYYREQSKNQRDKIEKLTYSSDFIQYTSDCWFEGFMKTYLI